MKLLAQKTATSQLKKDNDQLIETNIRLRKSYAEIIQRLNTLKEDYDPEKLKILKDFEDFSKGILEKKSGLLRELQAIENEIAKKKDIYYGVIEKQDLLDEKVYQVAEAQKKLDLREAFVSDLEAKVNQYGSNVYQ